MDRRSGQISDSIFRDLPQFLTPRDLLIFNNTKVIPARLFGVTSDKNTPIEILLVERLDATRWRCIGKPLKKITSDNAVVFPHGVSATLEQRDGPMHVILRFAITDDLPHSLDDRLQNIGCMPVPPYIRDGHGDELDRVDYQTIFAKEEGSIAAPTASLHFTPELMDAIKERGAQTAEITLHVGAPSFFPLWREGEGESVTAPGKEWMQGSPEILERAAATRAAGGRVFAIGTTVVRALESMARMEDLVAGQRYETGLFIAPPFEFKVLTNLITNFHQPRTTHLLLVEAACGRELLSKSYHHALTNGYRFLSYGDGMVLL